MSETRGKVAKVLALLAMAGGLLFTIIWRLLRRLGQLRLSPPADSSGTGVEIRSPEEATAAANELERVIEEARVDAREKADALSDEETLAAFHKRFGKGGGT